MSVSVSCVFVYFLSAVRRSSHSRATDMFELHLGAHLLQVSTHTPSSVKNKMILFHIIKLSPKRSNCPIFSDVMDQLVLKVVDLAWEIGWLDHKVSLIENVRWQHIGVLSDCSGPLCVGDVWGHGLYQLQSSYLRLSDLHFQANSYHMLSHPHTWTPTHLIYAQMLGR